MLEDFHDIEDESIVKNKGTFTPKSYNIELMVL